MAKDKFPRDLDRFLAQLRPTTDPLVMGELLKLRDRLVELRQQRLVKINHSIMEILCARHLIEQKYWVTVEQLLDGGPLVADLFGIRPIEVDSTVAHNSPKQKKKSPKSSNKRLADSGETLVVEVETGFVPPEAALAPGRYRAARIAAKIARYSGHSNRFALATPSYHVLQVPQVLLRPREKRDKDELKRLKALCDDYYSSPPIVLKTLEETELDCVYIVDVDKTQIVEVAPHQYLGTILHAQGLGHV